MGTKRQKFAELLATGSWTYEEMAMLLRVTTRTLCKWRAELGLPRRKRGRKRL